MTSIKMPLWLRIVLVIVALVLAAGGGLFGYRYWTHPVTLTVAVGSIDGEASKAMAAIASRLAFRGAHHAAMGQVAHELMPAAATVALLVNPSDPARAERITKEVQAAAARLGLQLHILHASTEAEIEAAFASFPRRACS
jgi:hypothetical protein